MSHIERIEGILSQIQYKPATGWFAGYFGGVEPITYIQHWQIIDGEVQKGRKWHISAHAVDNEIIQTALRSALDFEEHEAREAFKYKSKRIFNPHINPEALLTASQHIQVRDDA